MVEVEEGIVSRDCRVVVRKNGLLKDPISYFRAFCTLYIEDWVVVPFIVQFWRAACLDHQIWYYYICI